jgi:hypothetical protein
MISVQPSIHIIHTIFRLRAISRCNAASWVLRIVSSCSVIQTLFRRVWIMVWHNTGRTTVVSFKCRNTGSNYTYVTYQLFIPSIEIFESYSFVHIQSVHFARLLGVQNILSADSAISRQTEVHSFGYHLISGSVSVTPSSVIKASTVLCSLSLWLVWINVQSACELNTRYISVSNATFTFCHIYIVSYYDTFRPYTAIIRYMWVLLKLFHCMLYFVSHV